MKYDTGQIRELLKQSKTIAVVGLSDKPDRASYHVAEYLQQQGYKIVPINPMVKEVLGEKAYASLSEAPKPIDIVNVFRKSEDALAVVQEAIPLKPRLIWLQQGISNPNAARQATSANIPYIENHCLMVDHQILVES